MEPSTLTTDRRRRWRRIALVLAVIVRPGHHGQPRRRDRHARRRPPVRAGGRQGRPVPGRARPGPLRAGDGPGDRSPERVRRARRRPRRDARRMRRRRLRHRRRPASRRRRRPCPATARATATPDPEPARPVDVDIVTNDKARLRPRDQGHLVRRGRASRSSLADPRPRRHSNAFQRELQGRVHEWESYEDSHNGDWGPSAMALALDGVRRRRATRSAPTRPARAPLRDAAKAIEKTGSPVMLLAWRGAHTWVMTGFRADADPAIFSTPRSPAPTSSTRGTRTCRASGARPTRPGRSRTTPR